MNKFHKAISRLKASLSEYLNRVVKRIAETDGWPSGHTFVCLDSRLREAAFGEGFTVLPEKM